MATIADRERRRSEAEHDGESAPSGLAGLHARIAKRVRGGR